GGEEEGRVEEARCGTRQAGGAEREAEGSGDGVETRTGREIPGAEISRDRGAVRGGWAVRSL
ncbi:hypothetical protein B1218_34740, partial [Pseudomonas ogarae]